MIAAKTPRRTLFWARRCVFIEQELAAIRRNSRDPWSSKAREWAEKDKRVLLEYATESKAMAESEGYDDTAQYIQHIIDDLKT